MRQAAEIETTDLQDWLDDAVHEAKAEEASEINNQGIDAQLAFLGMTREEAFRAAKGL